MDANREKNEETDARSEENQGANSKSEENEGADAKSEENKGKMDQIKIMESKMFHYACMCIHASLTSVYHDIRIGRSVIMLFS